MPRTKSTHVDDPRSVGVRLKEAREAAGLSQRQLAFPGCSSAYISRIEAGTRTPSLQVLHLLGQRLGVSAEFLATGQAGSAQHEDLLAQADFAMRFDDLDGAEGFLKDALDEAANSRSRGRALEGMGQLAYRKGDPRKAADLLEQALDAYGSDIVDHPKLADTLGRSYAMLGDLNGSIQVFDRCLADAQRRRDQVESSRFGVLLGNALIDAADFERAQTLVAQTLEIVEELSDPTLIARLYWLESRLYAEQDDTERAARYARKALAIIEMTEDRAYAARAHQLLAHIELDNERPEEAHAILQQGLELTGDLSTLERAQYRLEEARALAGLGRTEEAASLAMEVSGVIAGANVEDAGRSYTLLADLFAQIGDLERAGELYELSVELLETNPNRYLVRAYRRHAELLENQGRTADAMELLKKAVAIGEFEQPKLRLPRLSAAAVPARPSY